VARKQPCWLLPECIDGVNYVTVVFRMRLPLNDYIPKLFYTANNRGSIPGKGERLFEASTAIPNGYP